MDKIRVEFTIDPEHLGYIVVMVEKMGAEDFTFATVKDAPKRGPGRPRNKERPPPEPKLQRIHGASDAVLKMLSKKGSAHRSDIREVIIANGSSPKSLSGLLWRLEKDGSIVPLKKGTGMYQLAKATIKPPKAEVT